MAFRKPALLPSSGQKFCVFQALFLRVFVVLYFSIAIFLSLTVHLICYHAHNLTIECCCCIGWPRTARFNGSTRLGVSLPEDWKHSQLPKSVFLNLDEGQIPPPPKKKTVSVSQTIVVKAAKCQNSTLGLR